MDGFGTQGEDPLAHPRTIAVFYLGWHLIVKNLKNILKHTHHVTQSGRFPAARQAVNNGLKERSCGH